MSAALLILPVVWAMDSSDEALAAMEQQHVAPEMAFYRGHTEGLLRRYAKLSMEAGRAPSLLGREMFRGNVTHYKVHGFDDVVIFVHDVEQCLEMLEGDHRELVERIALQEYTHDETAALMRLPKSTTGRWYAEALDQLTESFLERRLLLPMEMCQERKTGTSTLTN
jgi:hypothetical protein